MKHTLVKLLLTALPLAALLLSAAGCGAGESGSFAAAPEASAQLQEDSIPAGEAADVERKVVIDVYISMVVGDVSEAVASVTRLVREQNGYIVSSDNDYSPGDERADISFRVPSDSLEDSLEVLRRVGERVTSEEWRSTDVTEEFVDLRARIMNLEATEQQLLELFERADKMSDVLEVQREVTNIRGQIERLSGRLNLLRTTTDTSLVTVYMFAANSAVAIGDPGWSPAATANRALRGLAGFGRWFSDVLITLGIFSPVWVPIVGNHRLGNNVGPAQAA